MRFLISLAAVTALLTSATEARAAELFATSGNGLLSVGATDTGGFDLSLTAETGSAIQE